MSEVSKKISTTQVAGIVGMLAVTYNTLAPMFGWKLVNLADEQVTAIAGLIVMILPYVWMMWRRCEKSALKWGLFK